MDGIGGYTPNLGPSKRQGDKGGVAGDGHLANMGMRSMAKMCARRSSLCAITFTQYHVGVRMRHSSGPDMLFHHSHAHSTSQPSSLRFETSSGEKEAMYAIKTAALLLGALLVVPGYSDIPDDLIKSLPGWSGPLPSPQYSGYIKLDQTSGKRLHYW